MFLSKLNIINYRNCETLELNTENRINCIVGDNGIGKTNTLDAIYYLSFCKSFFNPLDSKNIRYGEDFFVIEGVYEVKEQVEKLYCGVKKGQKKKFKRNKKEYEKLADHIGHFPSVMISPLDGELISGGSDLRRKFIDGIISQSEPAYLSHLINYNKALKQRNALLKYFGKERTWDEDTLQVWDEQLVKHGNFVHVKRASFFNDFLPIFQERYSGLTQNKESVSITYQSQLNETDFKEALLASRQKDRANWYSNVGIHKDDLEFLLKGHSVKKDGSQGQQKSFLISLKLSQFEFIKQIKGVNPILLLDDIFDKLDRKRISNLMKMVSDHDFHQVFITDTNGERMQEILSGHEIEFNLITLEG